MIDFKTLRINNFVDQVSCFIGNFGDYKNSYKKGKVFLTLEEFSVVLKISFTWSYCVSYVIDHRL